MVAMGRALMLDPKLLLLDEPSAGLSPMLQDEVFLRCQLINETGVAILMVEQNARRCLQVCDRGYVLDQGRNAYTGTGRELLADPKVIELYLGTLARPRAGRSPLAAFRLLVAQGTSVVRALRANEPIPAGISRMVSARRVRSTVRTRRSPGAGPGPRHVFRCSGFGVAGSVAGVEVNAEGVADVAVTAVDRLVRRADALFDHRAQDLRRLVEADDDDRVGVGGDDLVDLAVERRRRRVVRLLVDDLATGVGDGLRCGRRRGRCRRRR